MWRSLVSAAIFSLATASGASAQSPFYVSAAIGGTYYFDQEFDSDVNLGGTIVPGAADVEVKYDVGFNVAGQVGYRFDTNVRIEGEIFYKTASGERDFKFLDDVDDADQDIDSYGVTAGVFLDLWPVGFLVPYVGGGIGYANIKVDNDELGDIKQDVLTAFGEVGVPYETTPALAIVPSLRINWYDTKEEAPDGFIAPIIGKDLFNTDFRVAVRYNF